MHKRLLFAKEGDAIWISHLDLMRVFQRAFRRAGMLLRHSQGYTPHAYVSILLPMSVGVSSQCEVLDYELDPGDTTPEAEIPAKLNACLPAGIRILASYESEKKAGKLGFLQARLDLEYDSGNAPGLPGRHRRPVPASQPAFDEKDKARRSRGRSAPHAAPL